MDNLNISHPPKKLQDDEILIFALDAGVPVYMFSEGRFWIHSIDYAQWLSIFAQTILLSDVQILMNDMAAGTYVPFNDFYRICPADVRATLNTQRKKLKAMVRQETGGVK